MCDELHILKFPASNQTTCLVEAEQDVIAYVDSSFMSLYDMHESLLEDEQAAKCRKPVIL